MFNRVNFQLSLISPGSLPHRVERSVPMSDISEQHFFFRFEHRILPKPNYDVQILAGNFKIFQDDAVRIQRKFRSSLSLSLSASVCMSLFFSRSSFYSFPPSLFLSFFLSLLNPSSNSFSNIISYSFTTFSLITSDKILRVAK